MLHRGIYNTDGEKKDVMVWSWRTVGSKLLGITPAYSRADRIIAWGVFLYSFVYQFLITFVLVIIWNEFSPWPIEWWGHYFFIVQVMIPGLLAFFCTFWFGIGSFVDMRQMFRDLKTRKVNHLDNGQVEGNMSLADKAELEAIDADKKETEK
jgi:hypothetical protein